MRLFLSISLIGVFAALGAAATPRTALAATKVVCARDAAFNTIQAAVNAAAPGDTIQICPGIYNEQVVVTKSNLTIQGAGVAATVLRPTVVNKNTTSIVLGVPVAPILLVDGATNVTIANLTIDGSAADRGAKLFPNCARLPAYVGIYYRNSSGTVHTSQVTNITSATVCAIAIRAENANIVLTNDLLERYGESGIACAGQNTKCFITENAIQGQGPVNNQSQAGIQIRAEAAGAISGNTISDHFLIGARGVPESSVGIFLAFAQPSSNPHLVTDNLFINNQVDVQRVASAAAF
jgi:hypothetical protein